MMGESGKGRLAALIALKLVCCGAILLAMGVFSLGSILSLIEHPLVQIIGSVLVLTSVVWWLITRRLGQAGNPGVGRHE